MFSLQTNGSSPLRFPQVPQQNKLVTNSHSLPRHKKGEKSVVKCMETPKVALLIRLKAKNGMAQDLQTFLTDAVHLAKDEPSTSTWFALKFDDSTFGIFDTFATEDGGQAHLKGEIAETLMKNAAAMLEESPKIEKVDLLAAKLP